MVAVALVLGAVVGSWAPGPVSARRAGLAPLVCGELPTTDVVLRSDLTCETPFHFVGDAPRVTIDLGGHTLRVPGDAGRCTAPGPCGAIAGAAAVRNGAVIGTMSDIGEVQRVLVVGDIEVALGFSGAGGPASVRSSIVLDGWVRIWGPDVTVAGSIIRGRVIVNTTDRAVRDVVVERNWIVQSPDVGVAVSSPPGSFPGDVTGRVSRNVIWGAASHGISLSGGIWNIASLDVEGNLLVGNGGDGFRSGTSSPGPPTALGGPVTLTGNVALGNRGHGIDAQWMAGVPGTGIVDGGGNRAFANATAPACTGVAC